MDDLTIQIRHVKADDPYYEVLYKHPITKDTIDALLIQKDELGDRDLMEIIEDYRKDLEFKHDLDEL